MRIFKKQNFGYMAAWILSFLPILFWLRVVPLLPRFSDFTTGMANVGQITGLIGMAMFAVSLILSARLHFLEKYFGGLNVIYNRHNYLGQIAFILLLFHPLFLLPKYAGSSFYEAYVFLSLTSNWTRNWGLLSLALMIILIVLTLYLKPKYNIWKWTHKFMGLAFFLAVLHLWFVPSDTSRDLALRSYMLIISGAGLIAFIYKTVLGNLLIKKYKYIVAGVRQLDRLTVEIIMKPEKERMRFSAGQFVFVGFDDKNIGAESHPFSIISGEDEKYLAIAVKNLGDYTANLYNLKTGSRALIEGPFGLFSYKNAKHKNQIWISGGIGITPFLSMAKSLNPGENYNIDLYYCVKNKEEIIFADIFLKISESKNNFFKIINFCSEDQGCRISAKAIENNSGSLKNKDVFICAPPDMIRSLRKQFIAEGVNKKFIHSEEFSF